jgi:signal transduction histidine kinase
MRVGLTDMRERDEEMGGKLKIMSWTALFQPQN